MWLGDDIGGCAMTPTPTNPTRPMSADEASKWLGGVVSADQLIEAAKRKRISHTKLPHDRGYLFFVDDLVDYCMAEEHRRDRGQREVEKSNGKLPKPARV